MACGLPVVAHDSARTEWVLGNDQFLVDTEDIAAIGQAIVAASKAPHAMQPARIAQAATFSWVKISGMYLDFFRELIGKL
jgi:glycosyltransferase involved in cell wall biosynthesis